MNEESVFENLLQMIERYRQGYRKGKFVEYHEPAELKEILQLDGPGREGDWDEIFNWVGKYLDYSVKTSHPGFVNRMWTGANLPSVVGEIVAAVTNTSACTYESAPVSTLLEKYMFNQMAEVVGFERAEGQMTTGSSNANMIAMMVARNHALRDVKREGLFGQRKIFGFVGSDAHYSMDKAANILGLGTDQLIKVPLNDRGEMELRELEQLLEKVHSSGDRAFFVAATAGTTVRGAYDSIEPVLQLRSKYGFWLHVDGAWGGAAVLSPLLKKKFLAGLEQADSFTCDFHKMLGAALMCNILLINNKNNAFGTALSAGDGSYLFRDEDENMVEDLGVTSLQCGRRVDSLKWFLDWKFFGRRGLGDRVEKYLELCRYAESVVHDDPRLELVVPRTSFNICFRYRVAASRNNDFNYELRSRLYKQGKSLVGIAYIDGKLVLRLLITNPLAVKEDVDAFFSELLRTGDELQRQIGG
ncbi:pyridoxal phosphate-dependent decarboxylase family protein [Desulforhopalus singaporensis]|uniref:Sulfinoalanine decarboxylase n=1 Tax=Desulforhopalus singaporensis TaxID=91360 RepID=A0A1H0M1G0_9BACT|nr:pyridoxal-dependent decarboxylase [Desulforhopalus singaporensis]SDO74046.1 sulfinoalanine decarboxylase [Desulforhopalus singaporensis]